MFVRGPCTHDARVLREAGTLASHGHAVTIIAALAPDIPRQEERDGFRIRRIPVEPFHLKFLGRRRDGARGPLFLLSAPFTMVDYMWRLFRATRGLKPDVYHAHDLSTLPAAFLLSRLRGAKLVYDSHELNLEAGRWAAVRGWPKWLLRRVEKFLIRRADAVITVNDSIAGYLAGWYGVPRPAVVMNCPEPVDLPAVSAVLQERLGLPPETSLVLYQGGLTEGRGLQQFVEAFRDVEGAVAVFLGDGPLRAHLERLAQERGLGGRVRFLEPVSQGELLSHTASATIGVVCYRRTSLNNYLSTPNKIFEYMMAGVPMAVSDFPEMARIVRENDLGETFDPDDPASIAAAINALLRRADLDEMRRRAMEIARSHYSWTLESKKLLSVYESLGLPGTGTREGQETYAPSP